MAPYGFHSGCSSGVKILASPTHHPFSHVRCSTTGNYAHPYNSPQIPTISHNPPQGCSLPSHPLFGNCWILGPYQIHPNPTKYLVPRWTVWRWGGVCASAPIVLQVLPKRSSALKRFQDKIALRSVLGANLGPWSFKQGGGIGRKAS